MAAMPHARFPPARADDGLTLIEVLVTVVMSLLVFTAGAGILISADSFQTGIASRNGQLQSVQSTLARITRELREATSVTVASSTSVTFAEPIATGSETITITCSAATAACVQTIGSVSTTELTGVANSDVFNAIPSTGTPAAVSVKLVVAASGRSQQTFTDETALRDVTLQ